MQLKTPRQLSLLLTVGLLCVLSLTGCTRLASQGINVDGVRKFSQGNYPDAANRFREAIARDPQNPDGYYNLAAVLHESARITGKADDMRQAEDLYNQCLMYDPDHAESYRGLAVLLTDTKRPDAAFRLLQAWEERSPNTAQPRIELARLLEDTGNLSGAKFKLQEALTRDPYNSLALAELGRIHDQSGEYAQALQDYQRSIALNGQQPWVKDRLAKLQASIGGAYVGGTPAPTSETRVVRQPSTNVRY